MSIKNLPFEPKGRLQFFYILRFRTVDGVEHAEDGCDVNVGVDAYAKDAAAGAVLILAVFAVIVGMILFGNIDGWIAVYHFYAGHLPDLCGIILLSLVSLIYIVLGPVGIKKLFKGKNVSEEKQQ